MHCGILMGSCTGGFKGTQIMETQRKHTGGEGRAFGTQVPPRIPFPSPTLLKVTSTKVQTKLCRTRLISWICFPNFFFPVSLSACGFLSLPLTLHLPGNALIFLLLLGFFTYFCLLPSPCPPAPPMCHSLIRTCGSWGPM